MLAILFIDSISFFVAEIKIQGFGAFGVGGIIAFLLGSIMLINSPIPEMRPSLSIIIAVTLTFGLVFLFLTYKVIQVMKRKPATGQEGMTGEKGTARTEITGTSGKVFVHGEWWNAVTDSQEPIPVGTPVIVVSAKNSLDDKIRGLNLGADDYLAKPFHIAELNARIKSVI